MKKEMWTILLVLTVAISISHFEAKIIGKTVAHECVDADFKIDVLGEGWDKNKAIAQEDAVNTCASALARESGPTVASCDATCQQLHTSCRSQGGSSSVVDSCDITTTVCVWPGFWDRILFGKNQWHCTERGAARIVCDCEYDPRVAVSGEIPY